MANHPQCPEITITEALAYGYFGSFLEPVVTSTIREAVIQEKGKQKHYDGSEVRIKIVIPENIDLLGTTFDADMTRYRSASLLIETRTKPLGIYIKNDKNGIIITDVPNTLRTLKTYLKRLRNNSSVKKKWFSRKSVKQNNLEEFKKGS